MPTKIASRHLEAAKPQENLKSDALAVSTDDATLANILALLREDVLTGPDSLTIRYENKLAAINSNLNRIQNMATDNERYISDLEWGMN